MATIAQEPVRAASKDGFYFRLAAAMAITVVLGFGNQFLMGRSTFAARPLVHLHAVVFMGWVAIFVTQSWLASQQRPDLHRRLGMLAMVWVAIMIGVSLSIVVDVTRRGTVPFFFQPQHFLVINPLTTLCFAALVAVAVRLRRHPDWHQRLQICAMTAIMGPAFGRLLPMPLLVPHAFETAVAAALIFPAVGAVRDWRSAGRVHPAWWWGMAGAMASMPLGWLIAHSPLGGALYGWVTAGYPGASIPGLAFPPPPPM